MICKECGETYDEEMFPVCPFCLTENEKEDGELSVCDEYQEDSCSTREEYLATETDYNENIFEGYSTKIVSKEIKYVKDDETNDTTGVYAEEIDDLSDKLSVNIQDVYYENKYHRFVDFCHNHSMIVMSDLRGFDFNELLNVHGIGVGKIKAIIQVYEQFINGEISVKTERGDVSSKILFEDINQELQDLDIGLLEGLGIKIRTINLISRNGYRKIRDLNNISVYTLKSIVGDRNMDKFRALEPMLKKSLHDLLFDVLSEYENEEEFAIVIKRESGFTLQELGNEYGVTRERIRQIIIHFDEIINPFMKSLIEMIAFPKEYVTVQELIDIYDNDDFDKIIINWCKNCNDLTYLDYADVFLLSTEGKDDLEKRMLNIAEDFVGEGINLYDNLEDLEELMQSNGFPYMDGTNFLDFIQQNGYKVYGDFVTKRRQTYGCLCAKIVEKNFPNGIKIYDNTDLNKLRQYANEEYGDIGISDNDRAFGTRLSDYLILSGKGTAIAESRIYIEMSLLDEIKEYIDNTQECEVYYSEMFSTFEGKLRMLSNIDNYNFLHGVLKLYYPNDYDFSNRDYLKKKGSGYKSRKTNVKIKDIIKSLGRPAYKNELKKGIPGLTDIIITNIFLNDSELVKWNSDQYTIMNFINITDEDKEYLNKQIKTLIIQNDGYCSEGLLFDAVKSNRPELLNKNNIETEKNLFYLCQKLFSSRYNFRSPHIGSQDVFEEMSIKNVALYMLRNKNNISFRDYQRMTEYFKWSTVTSSILFGEIEKNHIRITEDRYIKCEDFNISEEAVNAIRQVLKSKMTQGFVSLINFDYWEELPEIEYEWNTHLLRSIIDHKLLDMKTVGIKAKDRRFERGIVINAQSDIKDYSELISRFLKELGYTTISENNMLTLLLMNNLTYKIIPKDLYLSDRFKYNDGVFTIL